MTTTFSQILNSGLDTAVASTTLNALTTGSYTGAGTAINNTPSAGTTVSYDMADLTITLSSAVTTGAGSPNIVVQILPAVDGTNYPSASAAASPNLTYTFQFPAATSQTTLVCLNIPIPPYNFKVDIQNNLAVTLPATNTSTAQLQRKTIANW